WLRPRLCGFCHKAAFLPVRHLVTALIVWTALSWVFIGVAIYMRHVIFLFGSLPAGFFAVDICIRKAPLQAFDHN
ncbi:MAG TPA: hypothetical protein VMH83_13300, partial [Candidatus Acidoferrum sp.]|nr:hypothetical protein [Candidatus Acidoferrum sp.]